jgi:hypothetical protein
MTGSEHYRAAEREIERSYEIRSTLRDHEGAASALAEAQVHATLALAAATATLIPERDPEGNNNGPMLQAWGKAGAWE